MRALLLILVLSVTAPAQHAPRLMAVTIDDLVGAPATEDLAEIQRWNGAIIEQFQKHGIRAVAFVNEDKVVRFPGQMDARTAVLESWLEAGHELGNHNFGHLGLTANPLERVEEAVLQGEVITSALLARHGQKLRWYRAPMTQMGATPEVKAAFAAFLAARGYTHAPFTIETTDWEFNRVYLDALKRGDKAMAGKVAREYVEFVRAIVAFDERLARETFGRDIPQTLLIHVDALNAAVIGQVLDELAGRGYRFISLDEAMRDAAYSTEDGYVGKWGPSWLHRWRITLKQPSRGNQEPEPPAWMHKRYQELLAVR